MEIHCVVGIRVYETGLSSVSSPEHGVEILRTIGNHAVPRRVAVTYITLYLNVIALCRILDGGAVQRAVMLELLEL